MKIKRIISVAVGGLFASYPAISVLAEPVDESALELDSVQVTAERFSKIRNSLSPATGGSIYRFDQKDISNIPGGENNSFNQILLRAPGVANDSYGQLHIRGDHGNIQYRINGVILPEGINGFGQILDTRFADKINLLTGALPAQYGYRTAGVIEIETKKNFKPGGNVGFYGGTSDTVNPSIQMHNSTGDFSYYVTGSYLSNNRGIENTTDSYNPIHDNTQQTKGFAYMSYLLNPETQIVAMLGSYYGNFQIPNNPAQAANSDYLSALGLSGYNSSSLRDHQNERNQYGILAVQSSIGPDFDYQVSLFTRYTSTTYTPDIMGGLAFNGVASRVFRDSMSNGLQADGSYHWGDSHTIRMGMFTSTEDITSDNTANVFLTSGGTPTNTQATIVDNNHKNGNTLLALYLQDEWKINNSLVMNYGVRADKMNAYVSGGQLSPRLGLVWNATPETTFHAAYSRYFTPPPTELVGTKTLALFSNTTNAASSDLNGAVKPERSHYFDVGVSHQLTPKLTVGFDSYYKIVQDLIDEGRFGEALVYTPFNYDKGRIYGFELTASYKDEAFSAYANLSRSMSLAKKVVSAQYNFEQDELDYTANHWVHTDHDQRYTASAGVGYLWQGYQLSADAFFGSGLRRGFANTEHMPAYTPVNLGASTMINAGTLGKLETRLAIINLFDKKYELRDGSGIGIDAPQFGPRRGVFIGLNKYF